MGRPTAGDGRREIQPRLPPAGDGTKTAPVIPAKAGIQQAGYACPPSPSPLPRGGEGKLQNRLTPSSSPLTVVIAIGNPSRGDDAIGPTCLARLQDLALPGVELLTDFQLQVEHTLDLAGRDTVIFIDASVSISTPFEWQAIEPQRDASHSSHALSPQMLLHACGQIGVELPPRIYQLAIRGYQFELGDSLSPAAHANLDKASEFLVDWLCRP